VYTHLMPSSEDRARQAIDAAFESSCVTGVSRVVADPRNGRSAASQLRCRSTDEGTSLTC
jgi:hypothetical protein